MISTFKNNGLVCLLAINLLLLGCNSVTMNNKATNEKLIRDYYTAYEKKDSTLINSILAESFVFNSPVDDHINLKTYKEKCWPNCANTKKFDIEKLIIDGDNAFVTYNGWTNDGKLFRNTEYFKFQGGKIIENSCYFGPGVNYPNNTAK
jgi:hypothetical protein